MSTLQSSAVDEDKQQQILATFERQSDLIESKMAEEREKQEQKIMVSKL